MRLVTFHPRIADARVARVGVVVDDPAGIVDLQRMAQIEGDTHHTCFSSMLDYFAGGEAARQRAEHLRANVTTVVEAWSDTPAWWALSDVRLLAPVPLPNSIRDCLAYERHLVQCMQTVARWRAWPVAWLDRQARHWGLPGLLRPPAVWYERPIYYKGNRRSVVGPGASVLWPTYTKRLDFELEIGFFVGRQGRSIPANQADEYIAGYSLFNDFSARDVQLREMQGKLGPAKGKDFDTGNAIGPYLVTPDEIPDLGQLTLSVWVNSEKWSECTTAELRFSPQEILAYISRHETVYPGDFIGLGTLPNGCGLELDRWLKPGDHVELRGGPLGILVNHVVRQERACSS